MEKAVKMARGVTKVDAEIGFRIRQIRQNKHISQTEVAQKCGFSYQQLQKYELGRNRLSVQRMIQIADALGVDAGEFLNPAKDKNISIAGKSSALQNIDHAAATLWGRIKSERHKHMVVELLDILNNPPSPPQKIQLSGTQKRD